MISSKAKIGKNVEIGNFVVIEDGVEIGDGTIIRNFVELRKNTKIGKNCYIDSRVSTSGNCEVGNDVTLRYDTILARGCKVGDGTYICPRVMTNNLDTGKTQIGGAHIGKNCFTWLQTAVNNCHLYVLFRSPFFPFVFSSHAFTRRSFDTEHPSKICKF